jgi:hypothetical protein
VLDAFDPQPSALRQLSEDRARSLQVAIGRDD